jgi:hypothetical protein
MTILARLALAAALLTVAPHALAQAHRNPPPPAAGYDGGALRLGGLLGLEFGVGDTGLGLRLDGEMPIADVAPPVRLSGVLSLGYSRFTDDSLDFEATTNLVKLVPAARFTLPLDNQFALYGDVGLGFFYHSTTTENVFGEDDDSGVGLAMRFAAGSYYELNERLRVGVELGVNPYFGEEQLDDTSISALVGASFRL